MANVLIIDDDQKLCELLGKMVQKLDYHATCVLTLTEGLKEVHSGIFDIVLLDVQMPDGDGLKFLPEIRDLEFAPEVIIMTGAGDPDGAELAIRNGAWDYLTKPLDFNTIKLHLGRALQYRQSVRQTLQHAKPLKLEGIIGNSRQIRGCFDILAQASRGDANVLLIGETGTGKELFGRAIHENSSRAGNTLVVVDCAAMPENLVESSLFGYEKGAYTGADRSKEGLIKQADDGTLFLDEIGELSLSLQKKFLRVLQEKKYRPVGGKHEKTSDFRLVSATNRNPDQLVLEGKFRKDLLYRLRSITIEIPPLRDRVEDIKDLALFHIDQICQRYKLEPKGFAADFLDALTIYQWPGNVRELVNALDSSISEAAKEPILFFKHLPDNIRIEVARASVAFEKKMDGSASASKDDLDIGTPQDYREFRESVLNGPEKKYLQDLMALSMGNIKEACRISGLSRTHLYNLMKKHAINRLGWSSVK
jgi:two-component system NtrC family response regulator